MARRPTARYKVADLVRRSTKAWTRKDKWREHLSDCYAAAHPAINTYEDGGQGDAWSPATNVGDERREEILDSTLESSNIRLGNKLLMDFLPDGAFWAIIDTSPALPESVRIALRPTFQRIQAAVFATIGAANFDLEKTKWKSDLTTAGNAYMGQEWDSDRKTVDYVVIPQSDVAVEVNSKGDPTAYFIHVAMSWDEFEARYPRGKKHIPMNREDGFAKILKVCILDQVKNQWEFHHLYTEESDKPVGHALQPVQFFPYDQMPITRTPWSQSPKEHYGRSPVMAALADFKTLNVHKYQVMQRNGFDALMLWKRTPGAVEEGYENNPEPGAILTVERHEMFERVDTDSNGSTMQQISIQDLRNDIRRIMLDDELPPLKAKGNPLTFGEIQARMGMPEGITPL